MAPCCATLGDQTVTCLTLTNVGQAFLGRNVLDEITIKVEMGELLALVGPSGSGKSTLVHIAAGLIDPLRGRVNRSYAQHAMIFQEPRLLPWATAAQNIIFPLKLAGVSRLEQRDRLETVRVEVALEPDDLVKYPSELSGGMRQRVSIARALIVKPDFVYFDEPFTALDVALRRRMQNLVMEARNAGAMGGMFITHDLNEAARLADRIAVLDHRGNGIIGVRQPFGKGAKRDELEIFDWVRHALFDDPIFQHIHDVDERQLA